MTTTEQQDVDRPAVDDRAASDAMARAAGNILPFRLTLPAVGTPDVSIDGSPVDPGLLASVAVKCAAGEVTRVYLETYGFGTIEGDGIVTVHTPSVVDPQDMVVAWLSDLDPATVCNAVLERLGPGSGNPVEETLRYLAETAAPK